METESKVLGEFAAAVTLIVVAATHWGLSRLAPQFAELFAGSAITAELKRKAYK